MAGTFSNLTQGNQIATPNANTTLGQYQAAQNAGWSPAQTPGGTMTGANTGTNNGASNGTMYGGAQQGLVNYGTGGGNQNVNQAIGSSQNIANNQGTYAPQIGTAIGTLQGISQNQTPQVTQAEQAQQQYAASNPMSQVAAMKNNPNMLANIATGNAANMSDAAIAEQGLLQQNVTNALSGQSQQIGAANDTSQQGQSAQGQLLGATNQAGNLAQGQQTQQLGALSNVAGSVVGPGGVRYSAQSNYPDASQGGNTTFAGGQANAQVGQGTDYTNNQATLGTLTGSTDGTGTTGMTGDFLNSLQSAGLNAGTVNIGNALAQGLNANTSGPYASQQTAFQNIMTQYGKILGSQTVNGLLQSSGSQTISQFLQTLANQAQQVQKGYQVAGTSQVGSTAPASTGSTGTGGNTSSSTFSGSAWK